MVEGAQFGKLISMRNKLKTMNADQYIEARVLKRKYNNQIRAHRTSFGSNLIPPDLRTTAPNLQPICTNSIIKSLRSDSLARRQTAY